MSKHSVSQAPASLGEVRCHLGEGPAYDVASDTAFWFDILERRLFEADLGTGAVESHDLPLMASALATVDDERQLVATESGLYLRSRLDGAMTLLRAVEADDATTRSNDARAHPGGAFWFSMMGKDAKPGAASIYALSGGEVVPLFSGLTIPNAICFSADGTQGFFADTAKNELYRVALEPVTGLPRGAPSLLRLSDDGKGLDGAVTDREGLIWIARWGGSRIDVLTDQGDTVRSLAVPARQPSCPLFIGQAFDRLMVTTAQEGQDEAERAADPQGGATFVLTPGAVGKPEPRVRLGAH